MNLHDLAQIAPFAILVFAIGGSVFRAIGRAGRQRAGAAPPSAPRPAAVAPPAVGAPPRPTTVPPSLRGAAAPPGPPVRAVLVPVQVGPAGPSGALATALSQPDRIRTAVVLAEVLGPPLALR
ncbi:MAG TPA: hypothetical protein VMD91_04890 [Candidatus Sulfotelmatobacter sp.]|nr:hypothetical protein [Candidatus Sulfotelmatobacter sp.]